jgi:hypothetical protein
MSFRPARPFPPRTPTATSLGPVASSTGGHCPAASFGRRRPRFRVDPVDFGDRQRADFRACVDAAGDVRPRGARSVGMLVRGEGASPLTRLGRAVRPARHPRGLRRPLARLVVRESGGGLSSRSSTSSAGSVAAAASASDIQPGAVDGEPA